jgi:hypothetical protein
MNHDSIQDTETAGLELPTEPTDAPQGSAVKLAVLAQRAALGLSLFHPQDRDEWPDCTGVQPPYAKTVGPDEEDEDDFELGGEGGGA